MCIRDRLRTQRLYGHRDNILSQKDQQIIKEGTNKMAPLEKSLLYQSLSALVFQLLKQQ